MTADDFMAVLEGLRSRQPFHVVTVELHGGRRFAIDHPGAANSVTWSPFRAGVVPTAAASCANSAANRSAG